MAWLFNYGDEKMILNIPKTPTPSCLVPGNAYFFPANRLFHPGRAPG
jgi:hypothetical protein